MVNRKDKIIVTPTKAEDVMDLVHNLRLEDVEEIEALGNIPLVSLFNGFLFSDECYTAFVDNYIIGIFGYCSQNKRIWFLGSELSKKTKREWLINAKHYINHFLKKEPILMNTVLTKNKLHIQWLKRIGAKFSAPYFINNHCVQDFYIIRQN